IDHDLLMNFADRYGLKIKFIVKKNLTSAYEALAEGEGDLIAARLRQENFALQGYLPGPAYEETHLSLFCHQKSQVRELQDLANKKVALQEKDLDDLIENRLQLLAPGVQIKKFEKTTTKKLFSK